MFIMFSESALKNVKIMKQRCSALITSGSSTRVIINEAEINMVHLLEFPLEELRIINFNCGVWNLTKIYYNVNMF